MHETSCKNMRLKFVATHKYFVYATICTEVLMMVHLIRIIIDFCTYVDIYCKNCEDL